MFVIASSHANRNCETSVRIITSERNLSKWQISRIRSCGSGFCFENGIPEEDFERACVLYHGRITVSN
jgi:hypothetical protein